MSKLLNPLLMLSQKNPIIVRVVGHCNTHATTEQHAMIGKNDVAIHFRFVTSLADSSNSQVL